MREVGYLPELLRLLANAEQPLYSAYVFARENSERVLSIDDFLEQVDSLVAEEVLKLWIVSGDIRAELARTPTTLARLYENEELDGTYDPFSLSITISDAGSVHVSHEWEADIDFVDGRFRLRATTGTSGELLELIGKASGTRLAPETQETDPSGTVVIQGRAERL
jgi:hypothetical protein